MKFLEKTTRLRKQRDIWLKISLILLGASFLFFVFNYLN